MQGQLNSLMRDQFTRLQQRKAGLEGNIAVIADMDVDHMLPSIVELSRVFLTNPDGSAWNPQHSDGTFDFLPGFDAPI